MSLLPQLIRPLATAIGDSLTLEQLQDVVLTATGNGLFEEYAAPSDPRRYAVKRTLERLVDLGTERWLLTHILIHATTNESLRRQIVKACPETLVPPLVVDKQVERVLLDLSKIISVVMTSVYKEEIRLSHPRLLSLCRRIASLVAYKSLHECLHALHLKLLFPSIVGDAQADLEALDNRLAQLDDVCVVARTAAASLDDNAAELSWINELEVMATQRRALHGPPDLASVSALLDEVQRLSRLQLSRLNAKIFEAARELTLTELVLTLPPELRLEDVFFEFDFAVRDLNPTILARALYHRFWQDADNELALIGSLLDTPSGLEDFIKHWTYLRPRILWLATIDPTSNWSENARHHCDLIDDVIADERFDLDLAQLSQLFGDCCRTLRFHFFSVDAMLKSDCGYLYKIDSPLKTFLEEMNK